MNANKKFKEYDTKTASLKIQQESIVRFGDLQKTRKNLTVQDPASAELQVALCDKFESLNKLKVCEYFKILRDLDQYIGQKDEYNITYNVESSSPVKLTSESRKQNIYRRKCIIIEDSFRSKYDGGKSLSKILTCRNPFKCDNDLINYDMDSEDEWAEQNGEDLNENNLKSEDDEDDLAEEEEQKGFIVDDDYLSVSEMNYSNISSKDQNEIMADLARKKAIIQKNRESKEVLAKNNEM